MSLNQSLNDSNCKTERSMVSSPSRSPDHLAAPNLTPQNPINKINRRRASKLRLPDKNAIGLAPEAIEVISFESTPAQPSALFQSSIPKKVFEVVPTEPEEKQPNKAEQKFADTPLNNLAQSQLIRSDEERSFRLNRLAPLEEDEDDEDDSEEEEFLDLFVISTSSVLFQMWKAVVISASFISSFHYVQVVAFADHLSEAATLSEAFYSVLFCLDLILSFFTEHHSNKQIYPERRQRKITLLYLKGRFTLDVLALTPFKQISEALFGLSRRYSSLFLLVKLVRIIVGFRLLHYQTYMIQIKNILHERTLKMVKEDEELANSQSHDNTNITRILILQFCLKVFQLIVYLFCGSYFVGMLWLIMCKQASHAHWTGGEDHYSQEDRFINYFNLESISKESQGIAMIYFAFTSLSTVGLGDYHPRSNLERAVGAFMLLFGVALTSYIMDSLSLMLVGIQNIDKPFEQQTQLSQFLKTLERFNKDLRIPHEQIAEIEAYFEYRWLHNKNHPITAQEDLDLFTQLPSEVQRRICSDFLHSEFLKTHARYFRRLLQLNDLEHDRREALLNRLATKKTAHLSAKFSLRFGYEVTEKVDKDLLNFQSHLLKFLEPIFLPGGAIIQKQQKDFSEVLFMVNGQAQVGYNHEFLLKKKGLLKPGVSVKNATIQHHSLVKKALRSLRLSTADLEQANRKYHYPVRVQPGQAIGFFEVMFNRQTEYIYRIVHHQDSDCFFLRKSNWRRLMQQCGDQSVTIKNFQRLILMDYVKFIYKPISQYQESLVRVESTRTMRKRSQQMSLFSDKGRQPATRGAMFHQDDSSSSEESGLDLMQSVGQLQKSIMHKSQKGQPVEKAMTITENNSTWNMSHAETILKKQQTKLVTAITWKERIQDEGLRKLMDTVMRDDIKEFEQEHVSSISSFQAMKEQSIAKIFEQAFFRMTRLEAQLCKQFDQIQALEDELESRKKRIEELEQLLEFKTPEQAHYQSKLFDKPAPAGSVSSSLSSVEDIIKTYEKSGNPRPKLSISAIPPENLISLAAPSNRQLIDNIIMEEQQSPVQNKDTDAVGERGGEYGFTSAIAEAIPIPEICEIVEDLQDSLPEEEETPKDNTSEVETIKKGQSSGLVVDPVQKKPLSIIVGERTIQPVTRMVDTTERQIFTREVAFDEAKSTEPEARRVTPTSFNFIVESPIPGKSQMSIRSPTTPQAMIVNEGNVALTPLSLSSHKKDFFNKPFLIGRKNRQSATGLSAMEKTPTNREQGVLQMGGPMSGRYSVSSQCVPVKGIGGFDLPKPNYE